MAAVVELPTEEEEMGWLPLESNPDVLNPFAEKIGLPAGWGFCDVFGMSVSHKYCS